MYRCYVGLHATAQHQCIIIARAVKHRLLCVVSAYFSLVCLRLGVRIHPVYKSARSMCVYMRVWLVVNLGFP